MNVQLGSPWLSQVLSVPAQQAVLSVFWVQLPEEFALQDASKIKLPAVYTQLALVVVQAVSVPAQQAVLSVLSPQTTGLFI